MKLIQIFKELLKEDAPIEEDYPMSWNINDFKALTSFDKRIKYCNQHLKRLKSGSSRIVYQIDNEKVLKLARNKRGLVQNENEMYRGTDKFLSDIVGRVFDGDEENYLWIEMELVKPVNVQIFKNVTGLGFPFYCTVIKYIDSISNRHQALKEPEGMDKLWDDEFIHGISDIIGSYDIFLGDLMKLDSYGLVKRDGQDTIVIVDAGLGQADFDTHYK